MPPYEYRPEALACSDFLTTIYTALNARVAPFDATVVHYRHTFEALSATTTLVTDAEALAIECHLLLDKIDSLLAEQKALLEGLEGSVSGLSNLLSMAVGMSELNAKEYIENQMAGFWEAYWDAEMSSCVQERRDDVESEVEYVSQKIMGRMLIYREQKDEEEEKTMLREDDSIVWTKAYSRLQEHPIGEGSVRVGIDV